MILRILLAFVLVQVISAREFARFAVSAPISATQKDGILNSLRQHASETRTFKSLDHDFSFLRKSEDHLGNTYYRYKQTYRGVNVHQSDFVVRVNNDQVQTILGRYYDVSTLDEVPRLSANEAFNRFFSKARVSDVNILSSFNLLIFHKSPTQSILCYSADMSYFDATGKWKFGRVLVSAQTGEFVHFYTKIYTSLNREAYLYDEECNADWKSSLPGELEIAEGDDTEGTDSDAFAAYNNTYYVYWFYKRELDRDSYDNKGAKLIMTVDGFYYSNSVPHCLGGNAFWLGEPYDQMVYTRDSLEYHNLSSCLEIVAHENTHGVTEKTSELVYEDEPGAINEGLSDALGVSAKAWTMSGGDEDTTPSSIITNLSDDESNSYWIGGDATVSGEPIRYMNDPTRDHSSVDNYGDLKTCDCDEMSSDYDDCDDWCHEQHDNGYVHDNSGIFNLFFYLLAEGGKHPQGVTDITVTAVGMRKAYNIVYYANTYLFTPHTSFEGARYHLADAAVALYGENSTEWDSVHSAMDAVLVPGSRDGTPPDDEAGYDDDDDDDDWSGLLLIFAIVLFALAVVSGAIAVYMHFKQKRLQTQDEQRGLVGPTPVPVYSRPSYILLTANNNQNSNAAAGPMMGSPNSTSPYGPVIPDSAL